MKLSDIHDQNRSHLPVLEGLAGMLKVEKVLELGPGRLSTPLFLNRDIFKDLILLESYENNPDYAMEIKKELGWKDGILDHRWQIHFPISGHNTVKQLVNEVDLHFFDLCLIDDSQTIEERARTIEIITSKPAFNTMTVIHDFEHKEYQEAVNTKNKVFGINDILPYTALVWEGEFWTWEKCDELLQRVR